MVSRRCGGNGACGIFDSINGYLYQSTDKRKIERRSSDIDKQAENLFFRLVEQMAEHEGMTEKRKAEHPMKWVGKMNALREAAAEIANAEVIFVE